MCVPHKPDPTKRQVCSKGCNRVLKVAKARPKAGASTDKDLYDIVVCQVDHRIVCSAWDGITTRGKQKSMCKTQKWVKPVARCVDFDSELWAAGATCLANHAHKDTHPQCSDKTEAATVAKIKTMCKGIVAKTATKADNKACEPFRLSLAEYY